jgi:hypothetical protein
MAIVVTAAAALAADHLLRPCQCCVGSSLKRTLGAGSSYGY